MEEMIGRQEHTQTGIWIIEYRYKGLIKSTFVRIPLYTVSKINLYNLPMMMYDVTVIANKSDVMAMTQTCTTEGIKTGNSTAQFKTIYPDSNR